jgi:hypothetical protein
MRQAVQGKGVGEMPPDIKKQMDEAMKKNMGSGAPATAPTNSGKSTTP